MGQIAACPGVEYVKAEDISEEARAKERALEMKSEDLEGKPEAIKEKMVEGRVNKMFKEIFSRSEVHQGRLHDGRGLRRELRRRARREHPGRAVRHVPPRRDAGRVDTTKDWG